MMTARSTYRAWELLALVLLLPAAAARSDGPSPARSSLLRGRVLDLLGRPVPFVQVRGARVDAQPGLAEVVDETLEDGRFALEGLGTERAVLRTFLLGVPDAGTPTLTTVAGTGGEVEVRVDVGVELVVRAQGQRFDLGGVDRRGVLQIGGRVHSEARLFLEQPVKDGPARRLEFFAAIADGVLRFRRVVPGLPWTLWIPWSCDTQGTCFLTGPRLVPGERSVDLEPGLTVQVEPRWTPLEHSLSGTGPSPRAIWLERGPARVRVRIDMFGDGPATSAPVPLSSWTVRAYDRYAKGGRLEITAPVEAGGRVTLDFVAEARARAQAPRR